MPRMRVVRSRRSGCCLAVLLSTPYDVSRCCSRGALRAACIANTRAGSIFSAASEIALVEDFYVKEKNLVDWQWDSNQCNYVSSGKPSWSVTLKGSDLESQKGKMCPF